jgi:hypothetical protein
MESEEAVRSGQERDGYLGLAGREKMLDKAEVQVQDKIKPT